MYYLYGIHADGAPQLAGTFDSEQQLLAYVRWATLKENADGTFKFEQGSVLVGCSRYEFAQSPPEVDAGPDTPHNPSPSML